MYLNSEMDLNSAKIPLDSNKDYLNLRKRMYSFLQCEMVSNKENSILHNY